jgi:hypothetical protein
MQYYMWDLFFLWLVVIQDGATLMHYAVQTACSQTIKTLLLYNVDINRPDDVCLSAGISLLYFIFRWLDLTRSSTMLQCGWTPLHLAVQTQRTDIVKLLLIKGADRTLKTQVSKVNIFYKFSNDSVRTHLWIIRYEHIYGLTGWFALKYSFNNCMMPCCHLSLHNSLCVFS